MRAPFQQLYFGGLFSLVGLPILLAWYLLIDRVYRNHTVIEVAWVAPDFQVSDLWKDDFDQAVGPQQFQLIKLTGDARHDSASLQLAQRVLHQIAARRDTTRGVWFVFGPQAKYWTMIGAINLGLAETSLTFQGHRSGIWAYYPSSTPGHIWCGTGRNSLFWDARQAQKDLMPQ